MHLVADGMCMNLGFSIAMSHKVEHTCCSSVALERANDNTFTFTWAFTRAGWGLQTAARVTPSELLQHFKLKRATTEELASDLVFFYHA
jgi:hypothetical protein